MAPAEPPGALPVETEKSPLLPIAPPGEELMYTLPLSLPKLDPDFNEISPPDDVIDLLPPDTISTLPPSPLLLDPAMRLRRPAIDGIVPSESPAWTNTEPPSDPAPARTLTSPVLLFKDDPLERRTDPEEDIEDEPELNETSPDAAEDGLDTTRTEPDRTWSLDPDDIRMSPP